MKKETLLLNQYASCLIMDITSFETASNRAYSDMARRTLQVEADDEAKLALKKEGTIYLEKRIDELKKVKIDQTEFDNWHRNTCLGIRNIYDGYTFHYGQAQKWLNMLLKYLYAYDVEDYRDLFSDELIKVLHMPIDSKIIRALQEFEIVNQNGTWSRWGEDDYIEYQKMARQVLSDWPFDNPDEKIPFYWELINWPKQGQLIL